MIMIIKTILFKDYSNNILYYFYINPFGPGVPFMAHDIILYDINENYLQKVLESARNTKFKII